MSTQTLCSISPKIYRLKAMISDKQHAENLKTIYGKLPKEHHRVFNDVMLYYLEAARRQFSEN